MIIKINYNMKINCIRVFINYYIDNRKIYMNFN